VSEPGRLTAVAMDLAGTGVGAPEVCALLLSGQAVPLERLDREQVSRYGMSGPASNGFVTLADFNLLPKAPREGRPFALEWDDFRAEVDEDHVPLLGSNGNTVIPSEGLVVVAGQPGVGKTTVVLDLVLHLASGREWLGMEVPRPLSVLLVENEGPEHMFRGKINTKAQAWPHERPGRIWVQTWRWGLFSLADSDARRELGVFTAEHPVDVVVGDPLGTLGATGAGSPEDTRRFVVSLLELGLPVAWLFVHHFRKDPTPDEVNQLSGAWAGHLDSLMLVKHTRRKDEVRLSFPKMRWAEGSRPPLILGYVRNTQGLELLGEEGDAKLAVHALTAALEDSDGMTGTEVAKAAGLRRVTAEAELANNPHLFQGVPGAEVDRPRAKVVWRLVPTWRTSLDNPEVVPGEDGPDEQGGEDGDETRSTPLF
jgi:hypothetical protein